MGGEDPLLLLLPPLLPCLRLHSPALVHVCQLSFTRSRLPAFVRPFSFTVRLLSSTALVLVHPPSLVRSPLSTPTGCPAPPLPAAPPRPPHFPLAPHACAPAIRGCTGSFVHVRSCRSGACFERVIRPGSDGGPTRGLGGRGFDQSPETEHLMLGFARAV